MPKPSALLLSIALLLFGSVAPAQQPASGPSATWKQGLVESLLTCSEDVILAMSAHSSEANYYDHLIRESWDPDRPHGLIKGPLSGFGVTFDELRGVGEAQAGLNVVGVSPRGRVDTVLAALKTKGFVLSPRSLTIGKHANVKAWSITKVDATHGGRTLTVTLVDGQVHEGLPSLTPGGISLLCATRFEGASHPHLALALPSPEEAAMRNIPLPAPRPPSRPTQAQIERVVKAIVLCDHDERGVLNAPPHDVAHVLGYFDQSDPSRREDGAGFAGPFRVDGLTFVNLFAFGGSYGARGFSQAYSPDANVEMVANLFRQRGHSFAASTRPLGRLRTIQVLSSTHASKQFNGEPLRVELIPARLDIRGGEVPGGVSIVCSTVAPVPTQREKQ